jgi:hypothetical protein
MQKVIPDEDLSEDELAEIISGKRKVDRKAFMNAVEQLGKRAKLTFEIHGDSIQVFASFHTAATPQIVWGITKQMFPVPVPAEIVNELYLAGGKSHRAPSKKYIEGRLEERNLDVIRKDREKFWKFLLAQFKIGGQNFYSALKGDLICKMIRSAGPSNVMRKEINHTV